MLKPYRNCPDILDTFVGHLSNKIRGRKSVLSYYIQIFGDYQAISKILLYKNAIKTILRGGLDWFPFENDGEEIKTAAETNVLNLSIF
jgi:hypothetical protein